MAQKRLENAAFKVLPQTSAGMYTYSPDLREGSKQASVLLKSQVQDQPEQYRQNLSQNNKVVRPLS